MKRVRLNHNALLEIYNLSNGVFAPLDGFMTSKDYRSVVNEMHLADGRPWTIPITLDVPADRAGQIVEEERIALTDSNGAVVAEMHVEDVFKVDFSKDLALIFGTEDMNHPGVKWEASRSPFKVGGAIEVKKEENITFPQYQLKPSETKRIFKERKWSTITGFQTRNPVHRAHEYLQRIALEITDGLFIQPLIGWKKKGDVSPQAIISSYEQLLSNYYPEDNVLLGLLTTPMRYAGPREAVFHAIIRRNYGCTHFIVGRDHAGVGGYYKEYEAQEFAKRFNALGIEILALCGPYYCRKCTSVVTKKSCRHGLEYAVDISGTEVRDFISNNKPVPLEVMRADVAEVLSMANMNDALFVKG